MTYEDGKCTTRALKIGLFGIKERHLARCLWEVRKASAIIAYKVEGMSLWAALYSIYHVLIITSWRLTAAQWLAETVYILSLNSIV